MAASRKGDVECVRALLEGGAKPDIKDNNGRTALDYARKSGNREIGRMLRGHRRGE